MRIKFDFVYTLLVTKHAAIAVLMHKSNIVQKLFLTLFLASIIPQRPFVHLLLPHCCMKNFLVSATLAVLGPVAIAIAVAWLTVPNDLQSTAESPTQAIQIATAGVAR
ncbi:hypothetical protein [Noviherbaspirillum pedocola]|uniref:Uncharacterized protein n=1 Tax=Noviherbaspirillum pedocola TaxID=2801341 RepID=A0A934T1F1_9BURK|nr:hypothetical protein [Noviherbaspirillum pedocola]MBK4739340.1 hypothetical protein [Noviherbaspirillum pedocola]